MTVTETTTLLIACDNPDCAGSTPDPADRTGWLFVNHEVYGDPTQTNVYCCYGCLGMHATAKQAATA